MSPPTLGPTYGALLLGVLFSAVLFGVTVLQTFFYFQQFPSDRAWRKLAVSWLGFLDALHLALSAHFVYHYLVSNYSHPAALSNIVWSFKARVVIDALVVCSVHTLYTSRLWTLLAIDQHLAPFGKEARRWSQHKVAVHTSASRWLMRNITPWLVSCFVVVGYAIAIAMCYETIRLETFDDMLHAPWATYVPLGTSTVIDAAISGSLCYFLARCRPQSEAASAPVKTLIVYTLNTGVITSFFSIITISMMIAYPTTFIPQAIEFLVIKLYINSYMAMLNARTVLNPSSAHRSTRQSCLPSSGGTLPRPRSFRDPLDQKGVRFPSFPASDSSLQLTPYVPASFSSLAGGPAPPPASSLYPLRGPLGSIRLQVRGRGEKRRASAPDSARGEEAEADGEWDMVEVPSLRAPRLSHPDVCPQYGLAETAVGGGGAIAFPAAAHGRGQKRLRSLVSSSGAGSSAAVIPAEHVDTNANGPVTLHPLAAMFANPVDPLTPVPEAFEAQNTKAPASSLPSWAREPDPAAARSALGHNPVSEANDPIRSSLTDPPEYPTLTPPDRALSPLRFAAYVSSPHTAGGARGSSASASSFPSPPPTPGPGFVSRGSFRGSASGAEEDERVAARVSPRGSGTGSMLEIPARPGRPRVPSASAYSCYSAGSTADLSAAGIGGAGGARRGSGNSGRFAQMVSAARESRREFHGSGSTGAAAAERGGEVGFVKISGRKKEREMEHWEGEGVGDGRGVWVWGGPGFGSGSGSGSGSGGGVGGGVAMG